jgi:hypothetical protein
MNSNLQNQALAKPLRLMICAALAFAIASVTTHVIIRSAGQHEYGITWSSPSADTATPDVARPIVVAQTR